MKKFKWKDRKKYDKFLRKRVVYLVTQKIKKLVDIKKEYGISENTVRTWIKDESDMGYTDRKKSFERWKSYSDLEKILKSNGISEITLNKTKVFYNQLTRALDGYDYLDKDKITGEKAEEFVEFLPELYLLYQDGIIAKISQENKGLNEIEEYYSLKIKLFKSFGNLIDEFFILELMTQTTEMAIAINRIIKESQKILLNKKEKDTNLKSEVLKKISERTKTKVSYYLDNSTDLRDKVIGDMVNLRFLTIKEEVLVRFILKITKTQFLINEERQKVNREQFEIGDKLEKYDFNKDKSKKDKVSIRGIVYQFSKESDTKSLDNEVRKLQRKVKNTFEDLKSSYPEVSKMFTSDENLLKAYIFLLLINNKKPKDKSLKDDDIEFTSGDFEKFIKKGIKERKSLSVEEDKFIWNSFNTLAYYSHNESIHEVMLYLENIYNCIYIKSIAEGINKFKFEYYKKNL